MDLPERAESAAFNSPGRQPGDREPKKSKPASAGDRTIFVAERRLI
jgi:hypothetical protein